MARISFGVFRLSHLKIMGGLIDEALKRGHSVALFFLSSAHGAFSRGMANPTLENFPRFLHGVPELVPVPDVGSLAGAVIPRSDVFVIDGKGGSSDPAEAEALGEWPGQYARIRKELPLVSLFTYFYDNCIHGLDAYEHSDMTFLTGSENRVFHKRVLMELSPLRGPGREAYARRIDGVLEAKTALTGTSLFEPFDRAYRERKAAAPARDLVLFVPKIDNLPFMRVVMREHSRLGSTLRSLLKYRGRYLAEVWRSPRLAEFLDALEEAARKHSLRLISKSRPKHGGYFEPRIRAMSHRYLSGAEDEYYPAYTSLEILAEALACIHIRTFSVMEAVLAGVPSLNIAIPIVEKGDGSTPVMLKYIEVVRGGQPGTLFNWEGCVWRIPWRDATRFLRDLDPASLRQDPDRRAEYVRRFCGIEERPASARQADALEGLLR